MLSTILLDLTFRDIIAGIPRDAGAVIAFLLFALFGAFIWVGSRPRKSAGDGSSGEASVGEGGRGGRATSSPSAR